MPSSPQSVWAGAQVAKFMDSADGMNRAARAIALTLRASYPHHHRLIAEQRGEAPFCPAVSEEPLHKVRCCAVAMPRVRWRTLKLG